MNTTKILIAMSLGLTIAACSGGGSDGDDNGGGSGSSYSGKTTPATVDDSNNSEVASGVHIASKQAVKSEEGGGLLRSIKGSMNPRDILINSSIEHVNSNLLRDTGSGDYSSFCNGGGSASFEYTSSQDGMSGEYTYIFNNCTYTYDGYSVTYDGTMYWEFDSDAEYWLWEYDVDITSNYMESYSLNASYECSGGQMLENCTVSENFSNNGVSYRVTNVSFTSTGGQYDFTARIYHENYGYVDIVATDLVLCDDGGFSTGSIVVTDSTSSQVLSLNYSGCDDPVVVTYQGNTYNVDQ